MSGIAVFDVNETMLDLGTLDPIFEEIFGVSEAKREWFARLLHTSVVYTATGQYDAFGTLGRFALEATGASRGVPIGDAAWNAVADGMGSLQAFPDVAPGLDALADDGWTLVALTNSSQDAAEHALTSAGLAPRFAHILSVEAVGRFKPDPAAYLHAAETVDTAPSGLWMVAAHDWDLAGARAVGMNTAYIARPGSVYSNAYPDPDRSAASLTDLARGLTGR